MPPKILFVNVNPSQCGVYEFGTRYSNAINRYGTFNYKCFNTNDTKAVNTVVKSYNPDMIIVNVHPILEPIILDNEIKATNIPIIGMCHDTLDSRYHSILWPDPISVDYDNIYNIGRLIPEYSLENLELQGIPIIGTAGLAYGRKLLSNIIEIVNTQFEIAELRIHMPSANYAYAGEDWVPNILKEWDNKLKPGISIKVSTDYLSEKGLVQFLNNNDINIFLYDTNDNASTGISSIIDLALAARKPIAINGSNMFRHLLQIEPSINVDQRDLHEIIKDGVTPLLPFFEEWKEKNAINKLEVVITTILGD